MTIAQQQRGSIVGDASNHKSFGLLVKAQQSERSRGELFERYRRHLWQLASHELGQRLEAKADA